jgi:hypothetical protein
MPMLEGAEPFTQALIIFALIIMMILYLAPGILVALAAGVFAVLVALAARIAGTERVGAALRVIEAAAKEHIAQEGKPNGRISDEP